MPDKPTALDRLGWAMRAPLDDATTWRVLVMLTNHADATGLAFPKVTTIAEEIRRKDRQTRIALDALVEDGYIERVRLRSGGRLRGYLYRVLVPGSPPVRPDLLPVFAAGVALPDSWGQPVASGTPLPDATGTPPPVDQRHSTAGQELPTEEPPTGEEPSTSVVPTDDDPLAEWSTEVREITSEFARMVRANGHPLPAKGSKAATGWLREMDRLLRLGPPGDTGDDPPPPVDEIRAVMTWALTVSDFWPPNIRSVPKFREQYTRLRGQASRQNGQNGRGAQLADGYAAAAERLRSRT